LTNAFINTKNKSLKKRMFAWIQYSLPNFLAPNAIKLAYEEYFNVNDAFNHFLKKRYFPFELRGGWQSSYTDFMFAAYQVNLFTMYHELKKKTTREKFVKFTDILMRELMDLVIIREDRPESRNAKYVQSH
jgi:hypothetical protein